MPIVEQRVIEAVQVLDEAEVEQRLDVVERDVSEVGGLLEVCEEVSRVAVREESDQLERAAFVGKLFSLADVLEVADRRAVIEQLDFELLTTRADGFTDFIEFGRREDKD